MPLVSIASPFSGNVSFAVLSAEAETAVQANAVRSEHFRLGREAAHEALIHLGVSAPSVISRGEMREPIWPPGIVGSISHSNGLSAAAVAFKNKVLGLGLDIEEKDRLIPESVIMRVCTADELSWLGNFSGDRRLDALLVFSAKECIYKCFFPKFKVFLGFADAVLSPVNNQGFKFQLRKELPEPVETSSCLIKVNYFEKYLITSLEWVS